MELLWFSFLSFQHKSSSCAELETTVTFGKPPLDFAQDPSSHLHSPIPGCSQPLCFSSSLLTLSLPLLFLFLLFLRVSFSSPCFQPYPMLPSGLRSLSLGGLWMSYLHKSRVTLRFNGSKADPYHWVSLDKYPLSFLLTLWTISSCLYLASVTSLPSSP